MNRALRLLERSHDDTKVRDALRRRKHLVTDAITGEPAPHFVYRLSCGHLVAIFTVPLPEGTTYLFCGECEPAWERLIVEQVADAPDTWAPPAAPSCPVCAEAAATGSAVPVDHIHPVEG